MADTTTGEQTVFEPAGPGNWNRDPVHFPRPVTRYWTEMHPEPFKQGTNNFARYYGLLIDGLQTSYINGFAYNQVRPGPRRGDPAALPARRRGARREAVARPAAGVGRARSSPRAIAKHREIQAVDPDALSDDELAAYLLRCHDHHRR